MIAFDTIYHPENTMFLKSSRANASAFRSTEWTCSSARPAEQFKLYTGTRRPEGGHAPHSSVQLGPIRL